MEKIKETYLTEVPGTRLKSRKGGESAEYLCVCGNQVRRAVSAIERRGIKSCGCMRWNIPKVGERFNFLTFIGDTGKRTSTRQVIYLFKCDCGKEKEAEMKHIRQGGIKSCGCKFKVKVEAGQKYGHLLAIRESERTERRFDKLVNWVFLCTKCNKEKIIPAKWVVDGLHKSCGCNIGAPGEENTGARNSKNPDHALAHYWEFIGPNGERLEGFNLNHLVRNNVDLFDPADVMFDVKGCCNARAGLQRLFQTNKLGRRVAYQYKGWTIGARMRRSLAEKMLAKRRQINQGK
jgi:hypothetical protein